MHTTMLLKNLDVEKNRVNFTRVFIFYEIENDFSK